MVENKGSSCSRVTHAIFLSLLLLGGAVILGLSIYAEVTSTGLKYNLNWTGNSFWNSVVNLTVLGIIAGFLIIILAVFGFLAMLDGCCGTTFKVAYVIALILSIIALIFSGSAMLYFVSQDSTGFESFLHDSWQASVTDSSYVDNTCSIQQDLNCMGFYTSDCFNVDTTTNPVTNATQYQRLNCPACPNTQVPIPQSWYNRGCYGAFTAEAQHVYLPAGITAIVFAALGILDVTLLFCI